MGLDLTLCPQLLRQSSVSVTLFRLEQLRLSQHPQLGSSLILRDGHAPAQCESVCVCDVFLNAWVILCGLTLPHRQHTHARTHHTPTSTTEGGDGLFPHSLQLQLHCSHALLLQLFLLGQGIWHGDLP